MWIISVGSEAYGLSRLSGTWGDQDRRVVAWVWQPDGGGGSGL